MQQDFGMQHAPSILADDEAPACELIEGSSPRAVIFVCDHASNRVPRALDGLGLADHHLEDHIGWDIGAAAVARRLARWFGANAVLAGYSRLVVDLNRALHDAGAFPEISDGVLVPGNIGLSIQSRGARGREIYHPYHRTVRQLIDADTTAEQTPVFIAIHSFTPRSNGIERPCHIGVLWDTDPRLPLPLMRALRAGRDIVVADNDPYSGRHPADFTIDHHAEPLGIAHTGIEIRQDLVRDEIGQERWASRLADALRPLLERDALYTRLTAAAGAPSDRQLHVERRRTGMLAKEPGA